MTEDNKPTAFVVKDCALAAIATGLLAQSLSELRDHLTGIHLGCIYYHFIYYYFRGDLLRPHFDDPGYNNDFAYWARHALHDVPLAERLGIIDPADYPESEGLRQELKAGRAPENVLFPCIHQQLSYADGFESP